MVGPIWNSFRKEERSSKFNCPWIHAPDCHTGPDCSVPSSSSALFSLMNCLFLGSHSWPQCCHRQSRAPGLPRALQPSLLPGELAALSLCTPWRDLCSEPQQRGQQCQKADSCSLGDRALLQMDKISWLCFVPKMHLCDDAQHTVIGPQHLAGGPRPSSPQQGWGRTFPRDDMIPDIHVGHKAAVKS